MMRPRNLFKLHSLLTISVCGFREPGNMTDVDNGMLLVRQCASNRPTFDSAWGLLRTPQEGSSIAFCRSIKISVVFFESVGIINP